ncbi:SpaA isopeptide-forming pilin-related protein [Prescottella agglutinans]|uniref:Prealbumin-like fold domain-containing protein n=1 Tax=Prescottella agglutinans TaxID=1644129 RepID=A0ABT6MJ37_9NOCA|nr:SpaA isopeptide-forming pilin-related protein [Prescottella agglutinans]MDH6284337.1 hypothetical protein [Prescottella agglutinans]
MTATMIHSTNRARLLIAAVVAAVVSVLVTTLVGTPWARADEGEGLGMTDGGGYSGSYMLPDGDQGWCIDYLKDEPMKDGGGKYGAPQVLQGVSASDLKIAAYALAEGDRALAEGNRPLAAAVAGVIHSLGINKGAPWTGQVPAEARADYDRIRSTAPQVPAGTQLMVRTPEGWSGDGTSSGWQRILSVEQPNIPAPSTKPSLKTQASISGSNTVTEGAKVVDRVSYTGLNGGESYTLQGELMCKASGASTGATGEVTFTADASGSGTVDVPITITDGKCTQQVAFEKLLDASGTVVATHEDLNAASQTVGEKTTTPTTKPTTPTTTPTTPTDRGPLGTLSVKKVAAGDKSGTALEGATFEVRDGKGKLVETFTTTRRANSIALAEGSYEIVETKAPQGYAVADKPTSVDIVAERTTAVEIANDVNPMIDIHKYGSSDGKYLPGARFQLVKDGKTVTEWTSKNEVTTLVVDPGTYEIVEVEAPAGYVRMDQPQKVTVAPGDHKTVNLTNKPDTGTPAGKAAANKTSVRMTISSIPSGPTGRA